MNYNTITEAMEQVELPLEIEAKSVYRAFEHIQDGRAILKASFVSQVRWSLAGAFLSRT